MGAVITLLMPYLLRKYGMPVDQIAKILAIAFIPAVWSFLWSPIADTGLRRRTWAFLSVLGASLAMAVALRNPDLCKCGRFRGRDPSNRGYSSLDRVARHSNCIDSHRSVGGFGLRTRHVSHWTGSRDCPCRLRHLGAGNQHRTYAFWFRFTGSIATLRQETAFTHHGLSSPTSEISNIVSSCGFKPRQNGSDHFRYCASLTCSIQSTTLPSSFS